MLHNFTSLQNTIGVTELAPDIFYVSGEKATADGSPLYTVYSVDMRRFLVLPNGTIYTPPVIKEISNVPGLLNGMTYLHRSDNYILSADSHLGGVWKVYVDTGKYELIIRDPSMAGLPNKIQEAALGINGLRTQNDTLFYCNSGAQTFYRMPVSFSFRSFASILLRTDLLSSPHYLRNDFRSCRET